MFITQQQETQKPIEHKFDSHIWQVLLENSQVWHNKKTHGIELPCDSNPCSKIT